MRVNSSGKDFKTNVIKLMTGTFLSQLVVICSLPIITRMFSPEAFGQAALYLAVIALITMISCGRYEMAIPLPKFDRTAAHVIRLCLLTLLTTVLVLMICVSTYNFIAFEYFDDSYNYYLWVIPIGVLLSGLYTIATTHSIRKKNYTRVSIAKIITALGTSGLQVGFGLLGFASGLYLIFAQIIGSFVGVIVYFKHFPHSSSSSSSWKKRALQTLAVMRRYKKFPFYSTFSILLGAGSWRLPVLLFGFFYSPHYVGLYALSFRVFQMPVGLVSKAISQVFFQKIADDRGEKSERLVEEITSSVGGLALLPFIFLAISGEQIFSYLFGEEWADAGWYAQIMAPWAYLWFLTALFSPVFAVFERQELQLRLNLINFAVRLVVILVGGLFWTIETTILILSFTGAAAYLHRLVTTFKLTGSSLISAGKRMSFHLFYVIPIAVIAFYGSEDGTVLLFLSVSVISVSMINFFKLYRDSKLYGQV